MLIDTANLSTVDLRDHAGLTHPEAAPVAVGGPRAGAELVARVQAAIRDVAAASGWPQELNRAAVSDFDRPATRVLHELMQIVPADAASEDVWSFLTLVVLPDIAVWRFDSRADDRMLGRPRNVFRRLWWRGETVGVHLIDAPGGLGEDELVNIMERPSLAASRPLATALAEIITDQGSRAGIARSELMRDVSKRVLRLMGFISVDVLNADQIRALVQECFNQSLAHLGLTLPPPPPPVAKALPPSWLPDPYKRHELRWWDGVRWTEHIADAGIPGTDSAEPSNL